MRDKNLWGSWYWFLWLGVVVVAGCSSTPDKEAWLKDLPVEAQTSINGIRRQDIRLVKIYETKQVDGQLWMRAKGYADINDRTGKYFWGAKHLPNLEITIVKPDSDEFKQCQILMDQIDTKHRELQVLGDGLFSAKGNENDGFVGIFRVDRVASCALGSDNAG
jgi:hypothetical protein